MLMQNDNDTIKGESSMQQKNIQVHKNQNYFMNSLYTICLAENLNKQATIYNNSSNSQNNNNRNSNNSHFPQPHQFSSPAMYTLHSNSNNNSTNNNNNSNNLEYYDTFKEEYDIYNPFADENERSEKYQLTKSSYSHTINNSINNNNNQNNTNMRYNSNQQTQQLQSNGNSSILGDITNRYNQKRVERVSNFNKLHFNKTHNYSSTVTSNSQFSSNNNNENNIAAEHIHHGLNSNNHTMHLNQNYNNRISNSQNSHYINSNNKIILTPSSSLAAIRDSDYFIQDQNPIDTGGGVISGSDIIGGGGNSNSSCSTTSSLDMRYFKNYDLSDSLWLDFS